jgi:quercetin dioxygenase-like cupin family protein
MTFSIEWIPKGWGGEKIICNTEKYCGKLLYFVRDKQCSWHYHKLKDETFYIQSGKLILYYGYDDDITLAEQRVLRQGDKFHVPIGLRHRMYALEDTEMFEFSTQHFDDDSYRVKNGD